MNLTATASKAFVSLFTVFFLAVLHSYRVRVVAKLNDLIWCCIILHSNAQYMYSVVSNMLALNFYTDLFDVDGPFMILFLHRFV